MLVLKQLENDATVIYPLYVAILFTNNSTHWHLVFQIMPKILCRVYKNVVSAQNQISRTEYMNFSSISIEPTLKFPQVHEVCAFFPCSITMMEIHQGFNVQRHLSEHDRAGS